MDIDVADTERARGHVDPELRINRVERAGVELVIAVPAKGARRQGESKTDESGRHHRTRYYGEEAIQRRFRGEDGRAGFDAISAVGARRDGPSLSSTTTPKARERPAERQLGGEAPGIDVQGRRGDDSPMSSYSTPASSRQASA